MAKIVALRIKLDGDKKLLQQNAAIKVSFEEAVKALLAFNQNSDFDKKAQEALDLAKALDQVNQRLKEASKLSNDFKPPTPGTGGGSNKPRGGGGGRGGAPRGADYEKLIEQANKLREANGRAAQELRLLQRAIKEGVGDQSEDYKQAVARVVELKAQQQGLTNQVRKQVKAFEEQRFAVGSYKALNAELVRTRARFRELGEAEQDTIGKPLLARIKQLDKDLRGLDEKMGISVRNVGNYKSALDGLQNVFLKFAGIRVLGFGAEELVNINAEISDSVADVRKTTQLAVGDVAGYNDAVADLAQNLEGFDTRTSLADLLDISRIGGQLGIGSELVEQFKELKKSGDEAGAALALEGAREELEGFTAAIDQVNVALGDELKGGVEGISGDLGRLNELLGVRGELGVSGGILAIGSAINTLGAAGTAEGDKIVDFTKRMAGISQQAKFSAADMLGLGAALNEFGQSPEVAASALTQLLVKMGEDVPQFAKLAGLSVDEFSEILERNGNEALLAVLEGAGKAEGGLEALTEQLTAFGIDSVRATSVVGALTANTDRLRKVQSLANDQFKIARGELEGNLSITEEFNVKNQTLGAEIEKAKNQLIALVVDTGFQEFLATGVRGVTTLIQLLPVFGKFIKDNRGLLLAFGGALIALNAAAIATKASMIAAAFATARKAAADKIATISQWNLNAALNANPIGVVIGLVALLVGGIIYLADNFDTIKENIIGAWRAVKDFGDGTGILNKIVFGLTANIRAAIFVVENFSSIWAGLSAGAGQAIKNISAGFERLKIGAQILQLQLKKAFTFGGEAKKSVEREIGILKEARDRVKESVKPVAGAFTEAYAEAQRAAAEKAIAEERAKLNERKANARQSGKDVADAEAEGALNGAAEGEEKKNKLLEDARKRRANIEAAERGAEKKRRQKEENVARLEAERKEKERLKAIRKIRELEAGLAGDDTTSEVAKLEVEADTDIGELIGTPAQIVKATALIKAQLAVSIGELYAESRALLLEGANEDVESIGAGGILPSIDSIQNQADEISEALEEASNKLFDDQAARLKTSAQTTIDNLVGDPETVKAQGEAVRAQLAADLEALKLQREEANAELEEAELVRQVKVRELQLERIDQEEAAAEAAAARAISRRVKEVKDKAEAEKLTEEETKQELADFKDLLEEEEELRELEFNQKRLAILQEGSQEYLELATEIAKKEADINQEKADKILEQEKQLKKERQATLNQALNVASTFVTKSKEFLEKDEENRKEHGKKIKALSLAEVAINLIREIAGIKASNSVYPEPLGTIIKAAKVAEALIGAGIAVAQINAQEFSGGGDDVLSIKDPQSASAALSGLYVGGDGKVHQQGTKEPLVDSYTGNSVPVPVTMAQALEQPGVHTGLTGYVPEGHVFAVGAGYIPYEGEVIGAPHSQGGVKAVTSEGKVVELEGGELMLRNGKELYVINKTSTRLHRTRLNQLMRGSSTYSAERKAVASEINSAGGYGRAFSLPKMQEGGALLSSPISSTSALTTAPVAPPVPVVNGAGNDNAELIEQLENQSRVMEANIAALDAKTDAIYQRLITITVINDPKEMVKQGLAGIQEEEEVDGF